MAVTTETLRERETEEARKKLDDLRAKRAEIDTQIEQAELLIQAWTNFQDTLAGKFKLPVAHEPLPTPKRIPSTSRAPRGSREQLKTQIIDLVRQFPEGITAEGINAELQATDKKAKAAIAAVLSLMKTDGVLTLEKRRGPYKIAPSKKESEEAA
jgi:hypothetical protein